MMILSNIPRHSRRLIALATLCSLVSACGGGGSSTTGTSSASSVFAGPDPLPSSAAVSKTSASSLSASALSSSLSSSATSTSSLSSAKTSSSAASQEADSVPDAFSFNSLSGVALGSPQTSNEVTISGIDVPVAIKITGGEYSINDGAYTSADGTVAKGQKVKVRVVASSEPETATTAILTVGSTPASFKVTTVADTTAPTADILFPPPVSMTEGTSIVVRGTAADDVGVASVKISINNVLVADPVTPKAAGDFSKWQIDLPLTAKADNNVKVEVTDAKGNTTTQSVMVRQTDDLRNAFPDNGGDGFTGIWWGGEIIDKTSNRMLIIDRDGLAIFSVDLSTGKRNKFADLSSFSNAVRFGGFALNPKTQRIYFAVDADLYEMPLVNNTNAPLVPTFVAAYSSIDGDLLGDQLIWNEVTQKLVIIQDNFYHNVGAVASKFIEFDGTFAIKSIITSATLPIKIKGAVFDKDTSIYYLLVDGDSRERAIYTLDPSTGIASMFSDFSTIGGYGDRSFTLDKSHNRLLVVEDRGAINGVDLTSGKLTQVSDNLSVNQLSFTFRLIVDSRQNYAFLSENGGGINGDKASLYAMDLETGHRVVFSKPDTH